MQAQATVTINNSSSSPNLSKVAAADLADKEQTILELRETNEVRAAWIPAFHSVIYFAVTVHTYAHAIAL